MTIRQLSINQRIQQLELQVIRLENQLAFLRRAYQDERASIPKSRPVREADAPSESGLVGRYVNRKNFTDFSEDDRA